MTVQSLIDEIARKVLGRAENADDDLTNLILDGIKSALRRLPRFAKTEVLEKTTTLALSSGSNQIDISSLTDFVRISKIYYVDDGRRYPIIKYSGKFSDVYSEENEGSPYYYELMEDTLTFDKKADDDYTIYLVYFAMPDDSITTSDTLSLRNDVLEIVKNGATAYVWEGLDNRLKANDERQIFVAGLEKLEADYYRQKVPEYVDDTGGEE